MTPGCDSGWTHGMSFSHSAPKCAANGGTFISMKQQNLSWHPVVSRLELEEYTKSNAIKPYLPKNQRQLVFHKLKYGNQQMYKGAWGPELLLWRTDTDLGYVWATDHRSQEIIAWIRDNIFV